MITKRQKQVLDFIQSYKIKKKYSPSLEEIKKHFKFASVSTAHHHIKKLQESGYLQKEKNLPRAMSPAKSGKAAGKDTTLSASKDTSPPNSMISLKKPLRRHSLS